MRLWVICAVACSTLSCSKSSQPDAAAAGEGARAERLGGSVYVLTSIGTAKVSRAAAEARCDDLPFFGEFVLSDSGWTSRDSSLTSCDESAPRTAVVTEGAGRFTVDADTLNFFVNDSRIGVDGLVQRALRRGDSLVVWNSDLDGGDYLYLRRRP